MSRIETVHCLVIVTLVPQTQHCRMDQIGIVTHLPSVPIPMSGVGVIRNDVVGIVTNDVVGIVKNDTVSMVTADSGTIIGDGVGRIE